MKQRKIMSDSEKKIWKPVFKSVFENKMNIQKQNDRYR